MIEDSKGADRDDQASGGGLALERILVFSDAVISMAGLDGEAVADL